MTNARDSSHDIASSVVDRLNLDLRFRRSHGQGLAITQLEPDQRSLVQRERQWSLNGLCAALFAQQFCVVTALAGVEFSTAVSMRNRIPNLESLDELGCYIAVHTTLLPAARMPLGELVSSYQSDLTHHVSSLKPQIAPHTFVRQRVAQLASAHEFLGIGVTNIGKLDAAFENAGVEVTRAYTAVNRSGGIAAVVLHVSMLHGRLTLLYVSPKHLLDRSIVEKTASGVSHALRSGSFAAHGV